MRSRSALMALSFPALFSATECEPRPSPEVGPDARVVFDGALDASTRDDARVDVDTGVARDARMSDASASAEASVDSVVSAPTTSDASYDAFVRYDGSDARRIAVAPQCEYVRMTRGQPSLCVGWEERIAGRIVERLVDPYRRHEACDTTTPWMTWNIPLAAWASVLPLQAGERVIETRTSTRTNQCPSGSFRGWPAVAVALTNQGRAYVNYFVASCNGTGPTGYVENPFDQLEPLPCSQ